MGQTLPPPDNGAATLREVYALVESTRVQLLAQIDKVGTHLESKLELHEKEHDRDTERRNSLTRWVVTTLLSGMGVLVAIYLGVR